jgi:hypothetical protein
MGRPQQTGSNCRPSELHSDALPAELCEACLLSLATETSEDLRTQGRVGACERERGREREGERERERAGVPFRFLHPLLSLSDSLSTGNREKADHIISGHGLLSLPSSLAVCLFETLFMWFSLFVYFLLHCFAPVCQSVLHSHFASCIGIPCSSVMPTEIRKKKKK